MTEGTDQLALVRSLREQKSALEQENADLKRGGGGGTSGGMDVIDAKIAAAEARTDAKFTQVIAKLDAMDGKLTRIEADNIRTRSTVRSSTFAIISAFIAVVALGFAIFSQSFNMGEKVRESARAASAERVDELRLHDSIDGNAN
ncbi:hypothetical protein [Sphingomonas montanisoli]|uniref:Uncharacterized protein n=1 Tax=Sphingomonas montanisoli TaxID=2606412 RepID=A0A5D9C2G0_9SPHN|nr:hypothetical protein [Sphingomonas montanisoli]TZG25613.1 hypothetical protein FYJ91_11345 [Sphingomonas montanisoli]